MIWVTKNVLATGALPAGSAAKQDSPSPEVNFRVAPLPQATMSDLSQGRALPREPVPFPRLYTCKFYTNQPAGAEASKSRHLESALEQPRCPERKGCSTNVELFFLQETPPNGSTRRCDGEPRLNSVHQPPQPRPVPQATEALIGNSPEMSPHPHHSRKVFSL